ncbi:hypothetical protein ACFLS1_01670 [Verrucomicrobiota bacterium]
MLDSWIVRNRAGFEPAKTHQVSSKTDAFNDDVTQIGTHESGAFRRFESRLVIEKASADLQEIIHAWAELAGSLKAAALAVVRSQASKSNASIDIA